MNRKVLGLASIFVGAALVGCGGGSPTYVDGATSDGRLDGGDAKPDGAKPDGNQPQVDAGPLPMASPTSRPIVPAGAVLVGTGDNSCKGSVECVQSCQCDVTCAPNAWCPNNPGSVTCPTGCTVADGCDSTLAGCSTCI